MTTAPALHTVLGSGPAGTTLATELIRRGHPVRLVDRSGSGPAIEGVERYAADVATPREPARPWPEPPSCTTASMWATTSRWR
ncbi:hypothetical protein SMICM17S_10735 [Streptomyces microflavus]